LISRVVENATASWAWASGRKGRAGSGLRFLCLS
jgi:hypothetical protein